MAALAGAGCAGTGGTSATGGGGDAAPTTEVRTEDIPVAMGESVEVANLTATVHEVQRKQQVGKVSAGYVVARVTVANKSNTAQRYHRLQFKLRKPDGTSTNRTPIAGETQLGEGELEPGTDVSGQLIFTVEQAGGTFAVVFEPLQTDMPDRKRGVWSFESQPGDAR